MTFGGLLRLRSIAASAFAPAVSEALALKCEIAGGGVVVSGVEESPAIAADTSE